MKSLKALWLLCYHKLGVGINSDKTNRLSMLDSDSGPSELVDRTVMIMYINGCRKVLFVALVMINSIERTKIC